MNADQPNQIQNLSSTPFAASEDAGPVDALHLQVDQSGSLNLGDEPWFLKADFGREGLDLQVTGEDGQMVVIEGYFSADPPPDLISDSGAVLNGATATRLAGPIAPGQYAQAAQGPGANPIGRVETTSGTVQVTRADGTEVALSQGDSVFLGDILETGSDAAIGITFADESTFSLGEEGRMTLDDMVYDPGGQSGSMQVNLLQGAFTFVSGQIAKTDPNAMAITTPTSTIGIRGTAGGGTVDAQGATTAALMPEASGFTGEMTIGNEAGFQTINQPFQAVNILSFNAPPSLPFIMSPQQLGQAFGGALSALPNAAQALPDTVLDGANEGRASQQEAAQAAEEAEAAQAEAEALVEAAEQQAIEAQVEAEAAAEAEAQAAAEAEAAELAAAEALVAAEAAALEAQAPTATPEQIAAAEEAAQAAEEAQAIAEQAATEAELAQTIVAQTQALAAEAEANSASATAELAQATVAVIEAQVSVIQTSSTGAVASAAVAAGINDVPGIDALNAAQEAVVEAQVQLQEAQAFSQEADTLAEEAQVQAALDEGPTTEPTPEETEIATAPSPDGEQGPATTDNSDQTTNTGTNDPLDGFDYASVFTPESGSGNYDPLAISSGFDPFSGNQFDVAPPELAILPPEVGPGDDDDDDPETINTFQEVFSGTTGDDTLPGGPGNTQFTMVQGATLGGDDLLLGGAGTDEITLENLEMFQGVYDAYDPSFDPKMAYSNTTGGISGTIVLSSIEQLYVNDSTSAANDIRLDIDDSSVGYGYIIAGGSSADIISAADGTALADTISGATPDSTISGYSISNSTTLGTILFGKGGADNITGSGKEDSIFGGADNDTITGGAGNDTLDGGAGDDMIYSEGSDDIDGGSGTDTVVMSSLSDSIVASNVETITGGAGSDSVILTDINNTVSISDVEFIDGGSGIDTITITGSTGVTLFAGGGADYIIGGTGADILDGGVGADTLVGGAGIDMLTGGAGADTLTGGAGNDIFRYTAVSDSQIGSLRDVITDFSATDSIEDIFLDGLLTGTFAFLGDGTQTFTGTSNTEARFNDASKILEIDVDGNGASDMEIELQGVSLGDLGLNDFTIT